MNLCRSLPLKNQAFHANMRTLVMALTIKPTEADVTIARYVARRTNRNTEIIARALTWGADEKLLLLLAGTARLVTRDKSQPLRRAGNHALLVTVVASLLPHGIKLLFDQTRPDSEARRTSRRRIVPGIAGDLLRQRDANRHSRHLKWPRNSRSRFVFRIDSGRSRRSSPSRARMSNAQNCTSLLFLPECNAAKSETPSTPRITASPSITNCLRRFFRAASAIHGKRFVQW